MADVPDEIPPQRLRSMQVIAAALISGAVSLCAVVIGVVYSQGGKGMAPPPGLPMVSLVAGAVLLGNVVMSLVLPATLARAAVGKIAAGTWQPPAGQQTAHLFTTDTLRLLAVRQTTLIVGFALLEGAAFLCAIAFLMEGQVYVLSGSAVAVGMMLAGFPTANGVRRWLDRQLDAVRQARDEAATAG